MDVKIIVEFNIRDFCTSEELESVDMTLEEYVDEMLSVEELVEYMDYYTSSFEVIDVEEV